LARNRLSALPLQGSNLDSPDPESSDRGSDPGQDAAKSLSDTESSSALADVLHPNRARNRQKVVAKVVAGSLAYAGGILGVDPGLDACGWAYLNAPKRPLLSMAAMRDLYVGSGAITTETNLPDSRRLYLIGDSLDWLICEHKPALVAIEVPSIDGSYRRNMLKATSREGFMAGTMKHVHRVIGVASYVAEARGRKVAFLTKPRGRRSDKKSQHAFLRAAWGDFGRTNADERDAILIAIRAAHTRCHPIAA
jgi:Holliday junction resolvasome RuvABC endonuclease subunit